MNLPRVTAMTLALCVAAAIALPTFAATPINQTRPLDPDGRVEIDNLKGSIDVVAWDRPEVRIEGSLGEGVEKLEIEGNREHLVVRVKYPNRSGGLGFLAGGDNSEPSQLKLMVPLRADLEIGSVSASVGVVGMASQELSIESVSGQVTVAAAPAEAEIESVSGDLRLTLNSSSVSAGTVSGDLRLRGRLEGELDVSSVSGQVQVEVLDSALQELSGSTVSGDLHISTALTRDAEVSMESVSGDIDLYLPASLSANVSASSFSGDLSAPGADIVHARHGPGSNFEHRYGRGSAEISLETFSGDVSLHLDER